MKWKATKQKQHSDQGSVQTPTALYSARVQYDPQEMERNGATAKHVAWPSCAWLLLRFFPFPVGNPVAAHGTRDVVTLRSRWIGGTENSAADTPCMRKGVRSLA